MTRILLFVSVAVVMVAMISGERHAGVCGSTTNEKGKV
jgi:hypothetical protein